MTRVGQILVILLTVFAVLFMGFAVTVFTARTNWRDKFTKLKSDFDELDKKKKGLESNVKALSEDTAREAENHRKERVTYDQQIKEQQTNHAALLKNFEQERSNAAKYAQLAKEHGDLAKARTDEAVMLRKQLADARTQKEEAQRKEFEARQDLIELRGSYETLEARAKDLEQRQAELVAILEAHGMSTNPKDHDVAARMTPPQVEGVVLEVDPQGKFVKISIGSDDGLRKLHRLQVYRVKPRGKFVATIEITEVDPDQAVARILPQFKQGNIQEGDLVATRITASR